MVDLCIPEPHRSVGSVADFRSLVRSPAQPIFFPKIGDSHCDRIHSLLAAVRYFDNAYVGKQPVAGKNIVRSTDYTNFRKAWIGALAT